MIKFFYHPSPNPAKVALLLEEIGLPYQVIPIDVRRGEQHTPEFKAINPNAKTPALVDGEAVVFDSNAILLYLAEKTGKFLPVHTASARASMYSWLMFIASGIGPFSGQAVHFQHFAPAAYDYPLKRYTAEAWRHWHIINERLATRPYMLGETYTIVDMAFWGWAKILPFVLGEKAWGKLPYVKRLVDEINSRDAAIRAEKIKEQHSFKAEMDEQARKHMFPSVT